MWHSAEFMRRLGTMLRIKNDKFTHEPLPERWIELIHHLNEKEQRREARERQRKTQRRHH